MKKKKKPKSGKKKHSDSLEMFDDIFRDKMDMEERRVEREKAAWGGENLSDSTEMIDTVFREDLDSEEKSLEAKPEASEQPRRKQPVAKKTKPEAIRPVADKRSRKTKKRKIRSGKKAARESRSSRAAILLLLLIVLGGGALHYYRIVDFGVLAGYLGEGKKVVVQLYDKGKAAVKAATEDSKTTVHTTKNPLPKEPAPAPRPAKPAEKATVVAKPEASEKPKSPPKRIVVVTKREVAESRAPAQAAASSKPVRSAPKRVPAPGGKRVSYPYAIYLGSYSDPKYLQKAMSEYREMGLSPYWVKVDLGNKGVWRRIFAGYFETKSEADAFIREKQIPGAASKRVKYATLIGVYPSEKALETKRSALLELGYSPHVIPGGKGDHRLYAGAFYRKVSAENERAELASKGIQSQVVKR
ncbi:MAG: SPOR domain-containing protein [Desulfobacteraceae bacterium]|jgi:cell division protein FtsN